MLNGPQGTTFGAGAMAGAMRYITNKPDVTAFSAGIDLDVGKIDGGTQNGTFEGIRKPPDHRGVHGFAAFGVQRLPRRLHQQPERDTPLGERDRLQQLAWAGNDYNSEKVTAARAARPEDQRRLERNTDR